MAAAWKRLSSLIQRKGQRVGAAYRVTSSIEPVQRSYVTSRAFPALLHRMHTPQKPHMLFPRSFTSNILLQILTPPSVFLGLVATLWLYKCVVLVLFQNKIIYMPSIPPFSRSEKLLDYQVSCKPVYWKHHFIQSSDGIRLSILEGEVSRHSTESSREIQPRNVIIYFQG